MAHTYLVSDTRERYVHSLIDSAFREAGAGHVVAQINTGDYLVCRRLAGGKPEILACIERKTLKDFAVSLRDGRYENRHKMMDLRDQTGCQLYFIVEGPAFPEATWKVAGSTVYGTVLAAMTNLMVRDGIPVVQTKNEAGTAQRLLDFVRSFEATAVPYRYPSAPEAPLAEGKVQGVPDIVLGAVEKSDDLLAAEMWERLSGISLPTATILTEKFSVADLVGGVVSAADVAQLRTPGGRQLVSKGRSSLNNLRGNGLAESTKVLSGVPGISPAMATQILGTLRAPPSLTALLALGEKGIADIRIQQKGRAVRLGDARAERICHLLTYKRPAQPPVAAAVAATAGDAEYAADDAEYVIEDALNDEDLDDLLG